MRTSSALGGRSATGGPRFLELVRRSDILWSARAQGLTRICTTAPKKSCFCFCVFVCLSTSRLERCRRSQHDGHGTCLTYVLATSCSCHPNHSLYMHVNSRVAPRAPSMIVSVLVAAGLSTRRTSPTPRWRRTRPRGVFSLAPAAQGLPADINLHFMVAALRCILAVFGRTGCLHALN